MPILDAFGRPVRRDILTGEPASAECKHANAPVTFDADAARDLSASEVRRRWPRYDGPCPDCGCRLISYASAEHYVAGDW